MRIQTGVGVRQTILTLSILFGFMALAAFAPSLAGASGGCQTGATAPCAEDPAIQSCNVCHSIRVQGGNRNGTDRYITLNSATFRHILDPKQDWTSTVTAMVSKGATPADATVTTGYLNTNYCSTCTGVIISGPAVVNIKDTSATITWTTSLNDFGDGPANSVVFYGTSPTALTSQASDPTMTGSHAVTLTGLKASTKYYFQYQSTGADGKTVNYNFATPFFRTAASSGGGGGTTTSTFAYVLSPGDGSVSVVNMDKGSLQTTIFLNETPVGIAASPDGKTVYVTGATSTQADLFVIDTATNTIKNTISNFTPPSSLGFQVWLGISPDGQYLYALQWSNALHVISTVNFSIIKSTYGLSTCSNSGCADLAVSPDGTTIYAIAAGYFSTTVKIDAASAANPAVSTIVTPIYLPGTNNGTSQGPGAAAVAIGPDNRAWIPGFYGGAPFSVVNPDTTSATVAGMSAAPGVAVTKLGDAVYAPKINSNYDFSIEAYDTAALKVSLSALGTFGTYQPTGTAVTADGAKLAVAAYCGAATTCPDVLYIVDTTSLGVITSVPVGPRPTRVALASVTTGTPAGPPPTLIYSANGSTNNVSVIDPATNAVTATVAVGTNPLAVAPTPDGKLVIVVNGDGTVSVITRSTQTVTATLTLPDPVTGPVAALAGPAGTNLVYIANHNAMKIYVMNTQTNTITAAIPVGAPAVYSPQGPLDLAITPDGQTLYVNVDVSPNDPANADGYIDVISTVGYTPVARIILPIMNGSGTYHTGGSHIAMNPLGGFAYASADPYVVLLNTVSNGVVTSLKLPTYPAPKCYVMDAGVTPDGTALAASCWNILYLYDTSMLTQTMNSGQNVPGIISSIAITGDSTKGYLAGNNSTAITNVDMTTLGFLAGITVPGAPSMIAASPSVVNVPGGTPIVLSAPDLNVTSLAANSPVNLSVSPNITITGAVNNIGGSNAGSFVIQYYLSPSNVYNSATAISIGSQTVASLKAGTSLALNISFTVPASVATGDYYVLAYADVNQQIAENNEDNNIGSTSGTVHLIVVDLAETSATSPAIGTGQLPGSSISVTDTVTNQGSASAGTFSVGLYLYPVTGGKYTFLGSRSVSSLAPGASSTGTTTVKIPNNVAGGTYHLQAVADYNNSVIEGNKSNNQYTNTSGLITIPPADLIISAVSTTSTSVVRGGAVSLSYTVKNQGIGGASGFQIGFYLSTDNNITTGDKLLSYANVNNGLNAGSSLSGTVTLVIPTTVSPGTYYLGAYADYKNTVVESNESNNGLATSGTIQVQ